MCPLWGYFARERSTTEPADWPYIAATDSEVLKLLHSAGNFQIIFCPASLSSVF